VAPVIVYQQADSEFKGWYLDNSSATCGGVRNGRSMRRRAWARSCSCSARVAERYRRRDREVVAQEMWVRDEAGHLIARSVHHQSFLAEQTSGEVALRDPASKEGAKREASRRRAAVGRAPQDVHRRDVRRVLLPQPELSQRQGALEGARLRRHGDRGPHDALVRHRAPDPAFRRGFYLGGVWT
jgi:hypothetical protein